MSTFEKVNNHPKFSLLTNEEKIAVSYWIDEYWPVESFEFRFGQAELLFRRAHDYKGLSDALVNQHKDEFFVAKLRDYKIKYLLESK